MKTVITKGLPALFFITAITFTACQKEVSVSNEQETEATIEGTVNNTEAEAEFDDVFNTTMGIGSETGEDLGIVSGVGIFGRYEDGQYAGRTDSANRCFTITVVPRDPGVFPKTVTINFGDGCRSRDGRVRKGKIVTVYTGPMGRPGSKATTTFDGYKVDSVAVSGTHEVINNSSSNNRSFTTRVLDGKLTWDSGRWVRWSSTRTMTQIEGNGTPMWPVDDIFTITGAGRGENSRGNSWAHEVIEPLYKKFTCRWISKGILAIVRNGKTARLDFGDGACDNKATLTVNGQVREITLR